MNAQATRRGVPAAALWGGVGMLAWAAFTVLTGGSSAHADEESDPSLLGGVTSLVSDTVTSVGDTVTAVTKPVVTQVVKPVVTEVVTPVVTHVVAPVQQAAPPVVEHVAETVTKVPVVGPATTPVVKAVTDTAQSVVTPVTDLLSDAPVSQVVTPVKDALAALPGVGNLIDGLGVTTLLDDVIDVADATTGIVGEVVETTVPPVLSALDPTTPNDESPLPEHGSSDAASPSGVILASSTPASSLTHLPTTGHTRVFAPESASIPTGPATSVPASDETPEPPAPPIGAPATPSSSAGSSGASTLSHARLSDVGIPALRAVERTPGAPDDVLPTSLVADTDVSPD